MGTNITLYGSGTSRSSRCLWTLLELGVEFEYVDDSSLIGTENLRKLQPQGKLPAIVVDGESLFESVRAKHPCGRLPSVGVAFVIIPIFDGA